MALITNVIGRPSRSGSFVFVPVVLQADYRPERVLLPESVGSVIAEFVDDEDPDGLEGLWVRARLISIFGVNPPTGHGMTSLLNTCFVAVDLSATPFPRRYYLLLCDGLGSVSGDYGYEGQVGLAFVKDLKPKKKAKIANAFWSLLLESKSNLGVFSDYWVCEYDGAVSHIFCDGQCIGIDQMGLLNPVQWEDEDDELESFYPFEWPRRRRPKWSEYRTLDG